LHFHVSFYVKQEVALPRDARYPHMEKQGRIWYARLDVPRDLRHHFDDDQHPNGRRIMSKTTGETRAAKAYEFAKPIIDAWKAQFTDLRNEGKTATRVKAEHLARKYAKARKLDPTEAEYIKLVEVFDFAARDLIGVSARAWHEQLAAFDLDPAKALRSMAGGAEALEQVETITDTRTPFLAKITEHQAAIANALDGKTAYEYGQDAHHFAAMFPNLTIEGFSRQHVQDFISRRMVDLGRSRATVTKQVSGIRNYWTYLCSLDEALRDRRPFADLIWPTPKSDRRKPTDPEFHVGDDDDGRRFDPALVPRLWDEARRRKQPDLRDVMVIAAFTGGRREAITSLHRKTIFLDSPIPYLVFHDDKTEAGRRRLPIHPALMPILRDRYKNALGDGYLFRGGKNKIGDKRSPRLARPFRALLNDLDVPAGFGFHSFRRTFVDLLATANISELHAAKLVGHSIRTLTYGLYASNRLPLDHAYRIMVGCIIYPGVPLFVVGGSDTN
jgi:integrase